MGGIRSSSKRGRETGYKKYKNSLRRVFGSGGACDYLSLVALRKVNFGVFEEELMSNILRIQRSCSKWT
jgi:hypothetical protein